MMHILTSNAPLSRGTTPRASACPADVPFIVGLKIDFQGSSSNGCVAPAKNGRIYFQEGVKCDSGHLGGFVLCSSVAGGPLDQKNCPINNPTLPSVRSRAGAPPSSRARRTAATSEPLRTRSPR